MGTYLAREADMILGCERRSGSLDQRRSRAGGTPRLPLAAERGKRDLDMLRGAVKDNTESLDGALDAHFFQSEA